METSELVTQILDRVPGALLEKTRFGRSESALYWLGQKKLLEAARALKEEAGFEWLENLSAMQVEDDLVFTYFLRRAPESAQAAAGEKAQATLILRVSVAMKEKGAAASIGGESWVRMQSVCPVWPMAVLREEEISRLFGVRFSGWVRREGAPPDAPQDAKEAQETPKAPEAESGRFPLRKSFEVVAEGEGMVLPGGVLP